MIEMGKLNLVATSSVADGFLAASAHRHPDNARARSGDGCASSSGRADDFCCRSEPPGSESLCPQMEGGSGNVALPNRQSAPSRVKDPIDG